MPAPPRSFLTVTDTAIRWQVPALDIAGWAIDGEIARPTDGVSVTTADVIILRKEFERCERAWGLFDASAADNASKGSSLAKRPAGPGAPPKHDWDAFAGAIARRVHDHGMPVSQGELVRDMMDWFAGREDFPPPDERTVRRKVSAIWRELNSSPG